MEKCPNCGEVSTWYRNSARVDFKCGKSHNLDLDKEIKACEVPKAVVEEPVFPKFSKEF